MTTARCVLDRNLAKLRVRFGSADRTKGGQLVGISEAVTHPEFPREPEKDIAVLHLNEKVNVPPVPIGKGMPPPGTVVRYAGWEKAKKTPIGLKQFETQVIDPEECTALSDATVSLCIRTSASAPGCFADSGGPLVARVGSELQLVGASSRSGEGTKTCGTKNTMAIDVTANSTFITKAMKGPLTGSWKSTVDDNY